MHQMGQRLKALTKTEALPAHRADREAMDEAFERPAEAFDLAASPSDPTPSHAPVPTRHRTPARTRTARFAELASFGLRPSWAFTIDALIQAPFRSGRTGIGSSHCQARI